MSNPTPIVRRIDLLPRSNDEGSDEHIAAMLLFSAVVQQSIEDASEMMVKFKLEDRTSPEPNHVDVTMTINGVPIDPVRAMVDTWKRMSSAYERDVADEAMKMLKATKLNGLLDTLRDAEYRLQDELRKLYPDIQFSEGY